MPCSLHGKRRASSRATHCLMGAPSDWPRSGSWHQKPCSTPPSWTWKRLALLSRCSSASRYNGCSRHAPEQSAALLSSQKPCAKDCVLCCLWGVNNICAASTCDFVCPGYGCGQPDVSLPAHCLEWGVHHAAWLDNAPGKRHQGIVPPACAQGRLRCLSCSPPYCCVGWDSCSLCEEDWVTYIRTSRVKKHQAERADSVVAALEVQGNKDGLRKFKLKVDNPPLREHIVFSGGSILADIMANSDEFWVTRQEWQEDPHRALKKCVLL